MKGALQVTDIPCIGGDAWVEAHAAVQDRAKKNDGRCSAIRLYKLQTWFGPWDCVCMRRRMTVPHRTYRSELQLVTPGESDADAGKAYASPDRLPALNTTNAWRLLIHPSLCPPNESISLALASKCGNKPPREFANRVESGLSQAPRIREQVAEGADDDSAP